MKVCNFQMYVLLNMESHSCLKWSNVTLFDVSTITCIPFNIISGVFSIICGAFNIIHCALNIIRGAFSIISGALDIIRWALDIIRSVLSIIRGAFSIIRGGFNIIRGAFSYGFPYIYEYSQIRVLISYTNFFWNQFGFKLCEGVPQKGNCMSIENDALS
jgi:hypothetical protein